MPALGDAAGLGRSQGRRRLLEDGFRFLLQRATLTASARLEALKRSLAKVTDEEMGHDLIISDRSGTALPYGRYSFTFFSRARGLNGFDT